MSAETKKRALSQPSNYCATLTPLYDTRKAFVLHPLSTRKEGIRKLRQRGRSFCRGLMNRGGYKNALTPGPCLRFIRRVIFVRKRMNLFSVSHIRVCSAHVYKYMFLRNIKRIYVKLLGLECTHSYLRCVPNWV